ncbi:MAG: tetratricopeptide repeat protein [Planctomycetota bacterium]
MLSLVVLLALAADPVAAAADAVLAPGADVKALAANDEPDPWLVADELCARGEHDAADAFAKAAPRADVQRLAAYVASRRAKKPDVAARKAVAAANTAFGAGKPAEALAAIESAKAVDDPIAAIRLAFGRAYALGELRRLPESAEAFREAGRCAVELGWLLRAVTAFFEGGSRSYARSDYREALSAWSERLKIEELRGSRVGVAAALTNVGLVHEALGDPAKALEHFERALRMQEELGYARGASMTLGSIAGIHRSLGDVPRAMECLKRSLKISEELGDRDGVAMTLGNMGILHNALGDYPEALECHERSLKLSEELGDRPGVAATLGNIGLVRWSLGDYTEARAYLERALRLKEELGDRRGAARTLGNIALVHGSLGDYASALQVHEQVLKAEAEIGDREGMAATLGNIGSLERDLGDFGAALESHDRSMKLSEELGDLLGVSRTLGNIGTVHWSLGDYPKALECQERALEILRKLGDRARVATILAGIGTTHLSLGDYPKALEFHERSLALQSELGNRAGAAVSLATLGNIHMSLGDFRKALECQERSLALREQLGGLVGLAATLGAIGCTHHALGDYGKALEYQERARVEAEKLGARSSLVFAHWQLALTHLSRGDAAASVAEAREATTQLGRLATGLAEEEGARTREQYEGIFDVGSRAALRLEDPAELAFFLESGRAATLREALGSRAALLGATVPEELRVAEAKARAGEALAAKRHAAALARGERHPRAELESAQARLQEVIARIQRQAKAAAGVVYPEADSLEAIRGRVREGEALVLYGLFPEASVALVLTRGGTRIVRLADREAIEQAHEDLERISKLVVEPLGLGKETRRVFVSPAGALAYVPFTLLLGDREVVYLPSGTTYGLLLDEAGKRGDGALALGDPAYGKIDATALTVFRGAALNALPGTREEAKAVGDVVLLGADATEAALLEAVARRPRWRAVHLACHGLFDAEQPQLSSLALSGGDFLTVLDVFRAKVPADLVVLSACETAKGKVYRAEGVVGFVRAFMFAGAPRVIVSLWKVDDEATKALMTRFYELWKGGKACATALREAQRFVAAQEKWKDPKFWAAWQLWGLPE